MEYVEISTHAGERWHERRDEPPGYGPVIAWNRGVPLPDWRGAYCDEARYDDGTGLILLAANNDDGGPRVLTTVFRAATASHGWQDVVEQATGIAP